MPEANLSDLQPTRPYAGARPLEIWDGDQLRVL